jgi:nitrite reductase/ring-hydroxylating ferredoxin subunit
MIETGIDVAELPYQRFGIPRLGFRNYWYPAMAAGALGKKPKAVRLLGEDIVVYRDGGQVYALADRCPHRGVKLSPGSCEFPGSGTISCPYHGWTFDGRNGRLVAALMEGPQSTIVGKVAVKSYPVAERAGLIFVFVGDMKVPPIDDDLPPFMADPAKFFSLSVSVEYAMNWRYLVDNWPQDHHGPYLHRNSPELMFQPMLPFNQSVETEEIEGGKGIAVRGVGGIKQGDFPALGRFPRDERRRFMKPTGRGNIMEHEQSKAFRVYGIKSLVELRLPGLVVVGRRSGEYCLVQWAVPIDETRTLLFNINNFRRHGPLLELWNRTHYAMWRRWAHDHVFSGQDKTVVESMVPGAERLSRTDVGVIAWRKYAGEHARHAPQTPKLRSVRTG